MNVKKINVQSFAKKAAIMFAVLFELLVIILMIPSSLSGTQQNELLLITGVILIAPFIYGSIGYVTGTFIAIMFNLITEIIDN
jgi:high-affinity K+ transport system ATPase subunit B